MCDLGRPVTAVMGKEINNIYMGDSPASSPAIIMAGLHGPQVNGFSPVWRCETTSHNLVPWPFQGSFQLANLEAVRTLLTRKSGQHKHRVREWEVYALWAEQSIRELAHEKLVAQQKRDAEITLLKLELQKLREETGLMPSPLRDPKENSHLSAPCGHPSSVPENRPPQNRMPPVPAPACRCVSFAPKFVYAPLASSATVLPSLASLSLDPPALATDWPISRPAPSLIPHVPGPRLDQHPSDCPVCSGQVVPLAPPRSHPPQYLRCLRQDQCSYCKQFGHWKHNCPSRPPRPLQFVSATPGQHPAAPRSLCSPPRHRPSCA